MTYNYDHFDLDQYDLRYFDGPRAGDIAIDSTLVDINTNQVKISAFKGKWLVLEMGSLSCPQYRSNVRGMQELKEQYPDVEFIVVYVREAHPGEKISTHATLGHKLAAARRINHEAGDNRTVLVDTLDGRMHMKFGSLPNSVYLINPEGRVHFRCDWNVVAQLRKVLDERGRIHHKEHVDLDEIDLPSTKFVFGILFGAGWRAVWDSLRNFPFFAKAHRAADRHYEKHGQMAQRSTLPKDGKIGLR